MCFIKKKMLTVYGRSLVTRHSGLSLTVKTRKLGYCSVCSSSQCPHVVRAPNQRLCSTALQVYGVRYSLNLHIHRLNL